MTVIQRRAVLLLAVGVLGAAGMFLGPDDWFGVDLGPVGAAVLYGVLCVFVFFLATHANGVFPEDASPAERQAWVSLIFVALIGCHFLKLLLLLPSLGAAADQMSNPATRKFAMNLGLLIFGWISVAAVLSRQSAGAVQLDERDVRVLHAAGRFANGAMTLLMIWLIVLLCVMTEQSRTWMRPLIVGNVLLGLLIARALFESIFTVLQFRRARA